jgi:hypothetical protein
MTPLQLALAGLRCDGENGSSCVALCCTCRIVAKLIEAERKRCAEIAERMNNTHRLIDPPMHIAEYIAMRIRRGDAP